MALPFFALTLFVSAFLLFLVQPMIGKMILPKLGGTPQVWNTCMVFFQTALLAGYAYSHAVSTGLSLRRQLLVHCVLLFVPFAILLPFGGPFYIEEWIPPPGANPIPSTLLLLTAVVGLAFFVVATSAPLLQKWFASTGHPAAKDPYFLYAASNLGSMLALLAYPVIVERAFALRSDEFDLLAQNWLWTAGFAVMVVLVLICAALVLKAPPSVQLAGAVSDEPLVPPPQPSTAIKPAPAAPQITGIKKGSKQRGKQIARPMPKSLAAAAPVVQRPFQMTVWTRLRWVGLAAVPSSLMLGVITYMSTDVSAIPSFWVIPLALYLLSFILVFSRWPVPWTVQPHTLMVWVQPVLLLAVVFIMLTIRGDPGDKFVIVSGVILLAFFLTALVCHGELARQRPPTRYLTEFYLWMSVGGVVGGMFNGLLAPVLFPGTWEFPIALVFAGLLRPQARNLPFVDKPLAIGAGAVAGLLAGLILATLLGSALMVAVLIGFVGAAIGLGLGALYQPQEPSASWTERWIGLLFPGFVQALQQRGEELARNIQSAPGSATPTKPTFVDSPPQGFLLSYGLDVLVPMLLGLFFGLLIWSASSKDILGWKTFYNLSHPQGVALTVKENWLFWLGHKVLDFKPQQAYSFALLAFSAIVFGIPLVCCFLFYARPVRLGLALGVVLLANGLHASAQDTTLIHASRSYYGVLRVHEDRDFDREGKLISRNTYLMHGTTHHGLNYQEPKEMRRLATTYYHANGPVGGVMDRAGLGGPGKWTKSPKYHMDARLPASLVGLATAEIGSGNLPAAQLVGAWSEPAYATVGLGTGTMASYGRPFQTVHFYEIDDQIKAFSLPPGGGEPYFNYLQDALKRGVSVHVLMGDARLRMAQPWVPKKKTDAKPWEISIDERGGPEKFYRVIELDAFSSDAIPVHLITKEAIMMYFEKLTDDGVLCVHTSNRHVNLVHPVTDIAKELNLAWRVGKDQYDRRGAGADPSDEGRFGSEYVMLARYEKKKLPDGRVIDILPPDNMPRKVKSDAEVPTLLWYTPNNPGNRVWTDDYSNLLGVFKW